MTDAERQRLECAHCGTPVRERGAAAGGVYYTCGRCGRTVSSWYPEAVRRGAGVRVARSPRTHDEQARWQEIQSRLHAWFERLEGRPLPARTGMAGRGDAYAELGLPRDASPAEVKARYRQLAFSLHPDRGGDDDRMRRINAAYDALCS